MHGGGGRELGAAGRRFDGPRPPGGGAAPRRRDLPQGGHRLAHGAVRRGPERGVRPGAGARARMSPGGWAPLTIGRLHYEGGGDWYANPSSLPNLLKAIADRTGLRTADREETVTLADDRL